MAAIQDTQRTGIGVPAERVMDKLDAKLKAARQAKARRGSMPPPVADGQGRRWPPWLRPSTTWARLKKPCAASDFHSEWLRN